MSQLQARFVDAPGSARMVLCVNIFNGSKRARADLSHQIMHISGAVHLVGNGVERAPVTHDENASG